MKSRVVSTRIGDKDIAKILQVLDKSYDYKPFTISEAIRAAALLFIQETQPKLINQEPDALYQIELENLTLKKNTFELKKLSRIEPKTVVLKNNDIDKLANVSVPKSLLEGSKEVAAKAKNVLTCLQQGQTTILENLKSDNEELVKITKEIVKQIEKEKTSYE